MASTAISAQGTTLEVNTGTGSAVTTVTAAVGFPTIITKSAHGLSNGDVVVLSAFAGASAALLNGFTVVISNVTTNTLAIDIDTTGGTLTAANGTLTPQTYTEIGNVISYNGFDGMASEIPITNLSSSAVEVMLGLQDFGKFSFEIHPDYDDAGQAALRTAKSAGTEKTFKLTMSDAKVATFDAYVKGMPESGGVDAALSGSVELRINGSVVVA